jgi:hypothetical protein
MKRLLLILPALLFTSVAIPQVNLAQTNLAQTNLAQASHSSSSEKSVRVRATLDRSLELDPNAKQDDRSASISVKKTTLPEIELSTTLPLKTLALKVGLVIDRQGKILQTIVYKDSPTLKLHPELKQSIEEIIFAAFFSAEDSLFDIKPLIEPNSLPEAFFRIAKVQIQLQETSPNLSE